MHEPASSRIAADAGPVVFAMKPQKPGSTDAQRAFGTDDARYEALKRRDKRADGVFYYSVESTGVYCRPSCAARLALRKNVAFHTSTEAAERAGFRACKRCRPREPDGDQELQRVLSAVRAQLESASEPKTLAALAERVGLSPSYLQRLFKQHVGMSPRAYAAAHRLQKVAAELRRGSSVTSALIEAGYSSSSRFYEHESSALGVLPSTLRRGDPTLVLRACVIACSLGQMLVAVSERGVCAVTFGDTPELLFAELTQRFPRAEVAPGDAALDDLTRQIAAMVDQARFADNLPLDLIGTAFQQRVWRALRSIPRGQTCSYGELARRIGSPDAVRAVGSACGQNPIAAIVPCHRVLRADGSLGGYRWGLTRKQKLLARERDE